MRYIHSLIICIALMVGCQPREDKQVELQKAERVLYYFFNAMNEFNYQDFQQQITDDFQLLEDGLDWNADSLFKIMKFYEPNVVERLNKLEIIRARLEGSIAWISYWSDADIKLKEGEMKFRWLESALFKRQKGVWKIALLHVTQVLPLKG